MIDVLKITSLLEQAKSINASMGKIATPCFRCLWSDPSPDCVDNDWHRFDTINTQLSEAIELLKKYNE
jgi:hypothetical protein